MPSLGCVAGAGDVACRSSCTRRGKAWGFTGCLVPRRSREEPVPRGSRVGAAAAGQGSMILELPAWLSSLGAYKAQAAGAGTGAPCLCLSDAGVQRWQSVNSASGAQAQRGVCQDFTYLFVFLIIHPCGQDVLGSWRVGYSSSKSMRLPLPAHPFPLPRHCRWAGGHGAGHL